MNQGEISDAQLRQIIGVIDRAALEISAGLSRSVLAHAEDAYQLFQVIACSLGDAAAATDSLRPARSSAGRWHQSGHRAVNLPEIPSGLCSWLLGRISRRITSISSHVADHPTNPTHSFFNKVHPVTGLAGRALNQLADFAGR